MHCSHGANNITRYSRSFTFVGRMSVDIGPFVCLHDHSIVFSSKLFAYSLAFSSRFHYRVLQYCPQNLSCKPFSILPGTVLCVARSKADGNSISKKRGDERQVASCADRWISLRVAQQQMPKS